MRNSPIETPETLSRQQAAAETPPPALLNPGDALVQLRTLQAQLPTVAELTPQERTLLRNSFRIPEPAIKASIGVLNASSDVAQVVVDPAELQSMDDDDRDWTTFENELKAMLKRVSDGNIKRRQRTRVVATQAYLVAQQLARTPGNANLAVHVDAVKRLRVAGRRKKSAAPAPPAPSPANGSDTTPPSGGGAMPALVTTVETKP